MTWFYVKDGAAAGPISDEEFVSKLRTGFILPTTLVWREGMKEWQAASVIPPPTISASPAPSNARPNPILNPESIPFAPTAPPVLPQFFCTVCGNIIPADQLIRLGGRAVCGTCKPTFVQQASEGVSAGIKAPTIPGAFPVGLQSDLADPGIRLVAHLLDLLFLAVPAAILYVIFIVLGVATAAAGSAQNNASAGMAAFSGLVLGVFAFILFAFVGVFFYWTYFLGGKGSTPGMKIMKVKMVRSNRRPLGYGMAFGRTLVLYIINSVTMSLTNLTAFFDREKRTLVDMIFDTRVVRT